jgi:hypothetical protein
MKNFATLLVLFVTISLNAQIVNFTDPDLKTYLLNWQASSIDTNMDGEIQVTEALGLTEMLGISGAEITDLGGIEAFTNLTEFDCTWSGVTSMDLTSMTHLKVINCGANYLTSINLTGLTELEHVELEFNMLTSLDVSTLTSLRYLMLDYNELEAIDLTGLNNLRVLSCPHNQLTSMTLPSYPNNLLTISCGANLFESLDFTQLRGVLSDDEFATLAAVDCPNLAYVNLKNDSYNYMTSQSFQNCPNLHYICADEDESIDLADSLASQGIQMNSYCTFVPGGDYNTISGTVSFDLNNDGCDSADLHQSGIKLSINDGSILENAFTTTSGNYALYANTGSFIVTPEFEHPYFTIFPASATINFPAPGSLSQTVDFCIAPNGEHADLDVTIVPISSVRPGFDAYFELIIKNKGNQIQSGTLNCSYDGDVLDFLFAYPMTASQTDNTISWEFTNLMPFESRSISLILNANGPMETPPLNIGDPLSFTATLDSPAIDETPADNRFELTQTVIGSFDPNDKTCLEGETIAPEKIGDYLHYVIRFQNSGTAPAQNVVVKDMIDITKFDIGSFQLTETSHPQATRITDNKVEFIFENINLPAEQDDEPASHGFVSFKIKTKNDLTLNDTASNTADIFFDYNFPVITNTASTTVTELGLNEIIDRSVLVAPNPVRDVLTITAGTILNSVQIFDCQGRLIENISSGNTFETVDFSNKTAGVYLIKINTVEGVNVQKIIKQ